MPRLPRDVLEERLRYAGELLVEAGEGDIDDRGTAGEPADAPEDTVAVEPIPLALAPSPSLVPVPEIDPSSHVELSPASFTSWAAMFAAYPSVQDYLLTPGDYRAWGELRILDTAGGTASRPRTIRYHHGDSGAHPVARANEAITDRIRVEGTSSDWLIQGLTVRAPVTGNLVIQTGATRITFDLLLIEDVPRVAYGVRIRHATDATVQRCVIRRAQITTGDTTGIQVGNIDREVVGIKILDNEIYDYGDAIQLTDGPTYRKTVEVTIEGNDLYVTSDWQRDDGLAVSENAIDIKAGSDAPWSTVIRNNRMWGYRRTARGTSAGDAIVVQRYARNVLVEGNIIGEVPSAIREENWPVGEDRDEERNVIIRDNQFYEIRDYSGLDTGAATDLVHAVEVTANSCARCDFVCDVTPDSGYRNGGPVYQDNLLIDSGVQRPGSPTNPYDEGLNHALEADPTLYRPYQRRRWTGPEQAQGGVQLE